MWGTDRVDISEIWMEGELLHSDPWIYDDKNE